MALSFFILCLLRVLGTEGRAGGKEGVKRKGTETEEEEGFQRANFDSGSLSDQGAQGLWNGLPSRFEDVERERSYPERV